MSRFSEYLKRILDEKGEPVASVARGSGVERTSIYKALNDERILPYKSVTALARYFHLTADERREFLQAHGMLLQGEEAWQNRQAIGRVLKHLAGIKYEQESSGGETAAVPVERGMREGEYAVYAAIRSVLKQEAKNEPGATVRMFLPTEMDLTPELMDIWRDGSSLCVEQLFSFTTVFDKTFPQNIELMNQIIPLCLTSGGKYIPYYFSEKSGNISIGPFRCFIITPHYLIQIDQDQSAAWVETSPDLIRYFNRRFQSMLEYCDSFAHCASDVEEVLKSYIQTSGGDQCSFMMSQPCFGRYFTEDIIKKYLTCEDEYAYQAIFDMCMKRYGGLAAIQKDYFTVFTEEGLHNFVENGILSEMPAQYVKPIERKDRKEFILSLRNEIENGTVIGLVARPSALHIPDYLSIHVDGKGRIHFDTTENFIYGAYCCDIYIPEGVICGAFRDFFQYLPDSPLVYSREETLRMLDRELEMLDKKD